jgi:hypothetical protein
LLVGTQQGHLRQSPDRGGFEPACLAIVDIGNQPRLARRQARTPRAVAERCVAGQVVGERLDAGGRPGLKALAKSQCIDRTALACEVDQQRGELGHAIGGPPALAQGEPCLARSEHGDDLAGDRLLAGTGSSPLKLIRMTAPVFPEMRAEIVPLLYEQDEELDDAMVMTDINDLAGRYALLARTACQLTAADLGLTAYAHARAA